MKRKGNCAVKEEKIGPTVPPKLRSKTIVPLGLHLTSSAIRAPGCVRSEAQIAERHSPAQGIFLWAFPSQLYLWRGRDWRDRALSPTTCTGFTCRLLWREGKSALNGKFIRMTQ